MKHVTRQDLAYIDRLIEERIGGEKELVRQRFHSIEKATKLQAAEYQRRLDDLNHAREDAREVLATYLPREGFERYAAEQADKAEQLRISVTETRERLEKSVVDLAEIVEKRQAEIVKRQDERLRLLEEITTRSESMNVSREAAEERLAELIKNQDERIYKLEQFGIRGEGRHETLTSTGKLVVGAVTVAGFVLTLVVLIANHTFG